MKIAVIFLCIIVLCCSAPPPRKLFHEHLEDFVGLIIAEKGQELEDLMKQYAENKEFCMALSYFRTTDFKDMFYEIYSLPKFQDVIKFLEKDNIDMLYIIDSVKEIIDNNDNTKKYRYKVEEKQLNSFIQDSVNLLPKEKFAILLAEKKQEDGVFKTAVENLHSKKWNRVYSALWDSDMFQKEVHSPMRHTCLMGGIVTSMRHMCLMASAVDNAADLSINNKFTIQNHLLESNFLFLKSHTSLIQLIFNFQNRFKYDV